MNMNVFLCALKFYSLDYFQPFKNENAFLLMVYTKVGGGADVTPSFQFADDPWSKAELPSLFF